MGGNKEAGIASYDLKEGSMSHCHITKVIIDCAKGQQAITILHIIGTTIAVHMALSTSKQEPAGLIPDRSKLLCEWRS